MGIPVSEFTYNSIVEEFIPSYLAVSYNNFIHTLWRKKEFYEIREMKISQ